MTILLVEDDPPSARLFVDYILGSLGTCVVIDNIDAALGIKCDVVLLDLKLPPDMDEESTLSRISEFTAPVIIVTAIPDDDLMLRSKVAGAVSFFQKLDAIEQPNDLRLAILDAVK